MSNNGQNNLPRPTTRRRNKHGTIRSINSLKSGSTASRTRRVQNTGPRAPKSGGGIPIPNPSASKSVPKSGFSNSGIGGGEEDDLIEGLLEQVENEALSVHSQSYYSNKGSSTLKKKTKFEEQPKVQTSENPPRNRRINAATKPRNRNRYSGGINDFGEYDAELALEDAAWFALSLGAPNVDAAKDYAKRFHPIDYDGEKYFVCSSTAGRLCFPDSYCLDVFDERNESDFAKFGVGISLYFKWLKWAIWTFFCLSLVSLPQLFFNLNGAGTEIASIQSFLFASTLGNLVDGSLTIISVDEEEENPGSSFQPIGNVNPNATFELPGFQCDGEPCEIDRDVVQRLYIATDVLVLITFLAAALYLRYFTIIEYGLLQKSFRKVEQYSLMLQNLPRNATDEEVEEMLKREVTQDVHEVVVARDDGQVIELYQRRGMFIIKMWEIVGEVKRVLEAHKKRIKNLNILNIDAFNDRVKVLVAELNQKKIDLGCKYDEAFANYLALDEMRKNCKTGNNVVTAFVTFETAEAFQKAVVSLSKKSLCRSRKNIAGVEAANLPSFKGKKVVGKTAPPPSTILWENLEFTSFQRFSRTCVTTILSIALLAVSFVVAYLTQAFRVELAASSRNATLAALCQEDIVDPSLELDCQCSLLSFTEAGSAILDSGDECHDFWRELAPVYLFTSFAAGIFSVVSLLLNLISTLFAKFERHRSIQTREHSIGTRLYVALFINVGLALLLVNANFAGLDLQFLGSGSYADFEAEWFANVGVQIFIATFISAFTPHTGLMKYTLMKLKQAFSQPKVQAEMNKNFLGGEFIASFRFAQQLTAISITLVYGSGIPLFYPLAVINFTVYYWVDKFLFLRFYQTPPDFGDSLAKFGSRIVLLLVPIHAAFGLYMYTTPGLFVFSSRDLADISGSEFADSTLDRISLGQSVPHLLFVLVGLVLFILDTVFITGLSRYNHTDKGIKEDDLRSVTDGKKTGRFSSFLNSYNILENRRYMNAFGITPIFARRNKGVQSLFKANQDREDSSFPELPHEIRVPSDPETDALIE